MKRLTLISLILALFVSFSSYAQQPGERRQRPVERKEWFKELRQYKHDFLTKELKLTKEQQESFFPLYDEMESSVYQLQKQTRDIEHRVRNTKSEISDLEYEKASEAMFEIKGKEADIEMKYYPKFKKALTPKQMFMLKIAERKFTNELMMQHSRMRAGKHK